MDYSSFLKKKEPDLRIQFYSGHNSSTVALDRVESLAEERLKVLRTVESVSRDFMRDSAKYNERLEKLLLKMGPLSRSMTLFSEDSFDSQPRTVKTDVEDDRLSHFILSLAYSRTTELSNWFLKQEMELFEYRLNQEARHNKATLERFIKANNIELLPASKAEKEELMKELSTLNEGIVYKVKFTEVLKLVKRRSCILMRGKAFLVSLKDVIEIIMSRQRAQTSRALAIMRSNMSLIDQDIRLRPLLTTLSKRYIGKSYSGDKNPDKITAEQIPMLAKQSFPPCMEQLQAVLIREHHLKHTGRMQYGLFLKGIGVSCDESLKFFSESFQPNTDAEKFSKQYAYNIRHNYGLEGKRISYSPYSCVTIINKNVLNDCGGCPFKTMDIDLLTQRLKNHPTATPDQVEAILAKVRIKQYDISCKEYFKMMHNLPRDHPVIITHPNQYFEESRNIRKASTLDKF